MPRLTTVFSLATGAMAVLRPPVHRGADLGEQANATGLVAQADVASLCYDSADVSMVADEHSQGPKLALLVHRKTGFVLAGFAAQCFDHGSVHRLMAVDVGKLLPGEKAVHFARDPVDLVVSNFLYDKVSSTERNTLKAGGAGHHMKLCRKNFPDVAKTLPQNYVHESLREYLVRVPEDQALRLTMCQSKLIIDGLVDASKWCHKHENCMQVTLSAFMKDSDSYMQTWESITSFAGVNLWGGPRSCIEKQDINSDKWAGQAGHCTTHAVGDKERNRIKTKATHADVKTFGAYYKKARSNMGL